MLIVPHTHTIVVHHPLLVVAHGLPLPGLHGAIVCATTAGSVMPTHHITHISVGSYTHSAVCGDYGRAI